MTIETKFKIGDTIAFVDTKTMTLHEDVVTSFAVYFSDEGYSTYYCTKNCGSVSEADARASRDEIIELLSRPF